MLIINGYIMILLFFIRLGSLTSPEAADQFNLRTKLSLWALVTAMTAVCCGIQFSIVAGADPRVMGLAYNGALIIFVSCTSGFYVYHIRKLLHRVRGSPLAARLFHFVVATALSDFVIVCAMVAYGVAGAERKPRAYIVLHSVLRVAESASCLVLAAFLAPRPGSQVVESSETTFDLPDPEMFASHDGSGNVSGADARVFRSMSVVPRSTLNSSWDSKGSK